MPPFSKNNTNDYSCGAEMTDFGFEQDQEGNFEFDSTLLDGPNEWKDDIQDFIHTMKNGIDIFDGNKLGKRSSSKRHRNRDSCKGKKDMKDASKNPGFDETSTRAITSSNSHVSKSSTRQNLVHVTVKGLSNANLRRTFSPKHSNFFSKSKKSPSASPSPSSGGVFSFSRKGSLLKQKKNSTKGRRLKKQSGNDGMDNIPEGSIPTEIFVDHE